MTETVMGTAAMRLTLDTADYDIALDRAKQKQAGLGTVAQQEADKMTRAQRDVIASLDRRASKVGLTREQQLLLDIQTRTSGAVTDVLTQKVLANAAAVQKQGVAAEKTGIQFNQYGLSAKQTTAALRQVPAQITDIFVSLQGGQNPLTVLLQQGGQLKDVFGGVAPALSALGAQLLKLINPITLVAAAGAVVAYSFVNASSEQTAFAIAVAQSGRQADITTAKLSNMAVVLSDMEGVSTSQASDTLAKVAATGRFTAEQIFSVAEAAEKMRVSTGQSVDDTIAAFVRIAKDPVSAILELNESQNFLTQTTYQQIRALQEQGDVAGATAVALDAYAARVSSVTDTVQENIGYLQQFAKEVKSLWADISDAVLSIGRATTNADLVRQQQSNIEGLVKARERMRSGSLLQGGVYGGLTEQGYAQSIARAQAEIKKLTMFDNVVSSSGPSDAVNSNTQKQLDALLVGNRSREERQQLEEQQIRNLYAQSGATKQVMSLEQALAASRARYKESQPKGSSGAGAARSLANAESQAALQEIKNQEELARNEIQNTSKVLQAQYSTRLVTVGDYYAKQRDLVTRDLAAQEQSLTKQIDYLKARDVAGMDSVKVTQQIAELEARLAKVRADGATQLVILGVQEEDVARKRKLAVDAYMQSLDTSNESARKQVEASLSRIIMGQREVEHQEKLAAVLADAAEKQRQLAREYAETNDYAAYQEKLAALKDYTDEQVRIVEDGYSRMREAESDWLNGFKGALAQWMEGASNVAEQTNAITQRTLDGTVDMLTNAAVTGKLVWKDLLLDIGEQIAKFMMKQAVLQFLQYFMGGTASGTMGGGSSWFGGIFAAKGGAFSGAAGLSKHSGTVVDRPTPFYFAKGAGVMGEAGMEGIFPLQRGSDGKLGVKAIGGGSAAPVYITTSVTVNSDGSASSSTRTAGEQAAMYRELGDNMASVAQREIMRAMSPGGLIWKARVM